MTITFADREAGSSAAGDLIETDVPPDVLSKLLRRTAEQWSRLGATDPHWSVLTDERYRANTIGENIDAFYASGRETAAYLEAFEQRAGITLPRGSCLELGCGVGRITTHLARNFEHVTAVDVSPGNLAVCRERLEHEGLANKVTCILARDISDFDALEPADVFLSFITLQHNSPPVQKEILSRIVSKIKTGCLFQVVTNWRGYRFCTSDYLALGDLEMEMHALPQHVIIDLLAASDFRLREIVSDHWFNEYGSNTFFAAKNVALIESA